MQQGPRSIADHAPADHPPIPAPRIGVLIVNLGTPEAATAPSVRQYLREFLSDTRIVDYPRAFWLPLLYGVILNTRPPKTARAYASIWRTESNESPLRYYTRSTAEKLQAAVHQSLGPDVRIEWAMRYGAPSIADRITSLKNDGVERLLVIPQYPQYSTTTTASVHDAVFNAVQQLRWQPALRIAPAFHDDPAYIDALAATTTASIAALSSPPERVLLSFHGIPQRFFDAGDPYHCHCAKTARLLREKMGWSAAFAPLTFQSRFGPEQWLQPATDAKITALAAEGIKNIAVLTPGFTADCIETLEEIGIAGQESFVEAGGEKLTALPCLNDSSSMVDLLETLTKRELSGWI